MAYSSFTLPEVRKTFGLDFDEARDLFATVPEIAPSQHLSTTLAENVPLGLAINTEKARSEFIVAPILGEVRRLLKPNCSLFSGSEFNVDPSLGLSGDCDFLVSRSPEQWFICAPVVTVVEAKRDDIKGGLGQCIAQMIAAQRFNEREGTGIHTVYGVVTTGSVWKFLQLDMPTAAIDISEYYLATVGKVLGILCHMVR